LVLPISTTQKYVDLFSNGLTLSIHLKPIKMENIEDVILNSIVSIGAPIC